MKKFKHFLGILLSGALLFAFSACGQTAPPQSQAPAQNQESISAENSTEISPSEDSNPETAADAIKRQNVGGLLLRYRKHERGRLSHLVGHCRLAGGQFHRNRMTLAEKQ